MRLSDIAEVRIGHNFRRELISLEKKECIVSTIPVVQPRDVKNFNHINTCNLEKADVVNAKEKYFLYQNEVLFTNKGDFKAAIWKNNLQTIASSAFYRIKLINEKYYPEFVALYLSSPICKSQLNLRQNTERVSTITINELKQIASWASKYSIRKAKTNCWVVFTLWKRGGYIWKNKAIQKKTNKLNIKSDY